MAVLFFRRAGVTSLSIFGWPSPGADDGQVADEPQDFNFPEPYLAWGVKFLFYYHPGPLCWCRGGIRIIRSISAEFSSMVITHVAGDIRGGAGISKSTW